MPASTSQQRKVLVPEGNPKKVFICHRDPNSLGEAISEIATLSARNVRRELLNISPKVVDKGARGYYILSN